MLALQNADMNCRHPKLLKEIFIEQVRPSPEITQAILNKRFQYQLYCGIRILTAKVISEKNKRSV
jgi:hypothetical protein